MLRYAILGLVQRGPITGYDISKAFSVNALASFWHARHSQIYPELRKLTEEGLVTCETVIQGEKMEKKLYTITEAGKEEFLQWALKDEPLEPVPKDAFRLRTYFSESLPPEDFLRLLNSQLAMRLDRLTPLEEKYQGIPQVPPLGTPEFSDYLILEGALFRERAYVDWLQRCIQLMEDQSIR